MDRSIIIPTLNAPLLPSLLDMLCQHYQPDSTEIIVVGFEKSLPAHLASNIRYIQLTPPFSPAEARNTGAQASCGTILVFLDSDVVLQPTTLSALTEPILQHTHDIVSGAVEIEAGSYWRLCANLMGFAIFSTDMAREERDYLPTMLLAITRHTWDQVGAFNTNFHHAAGEDVEWTLRAHQLQKRLLFEPAARCFHRPARTQYARAIDKLQLYGSAWGHVYTLMLRGSAITPRYSARQRIEDIQGLLRAGRQYNSQAEAVWLIWVQLWCVMLTIRDLLVSLRSQQVFRRFWYAIPGIMVLQFAWYAGLQQYLLANERDRP